MRLGAHLELQQKYFPPLFDTSSHLGIYNMWHDT